MNDKVQFQTNVPIELVLKFDNGKPGTSEHGDYVRYTVFEAGEEKTLFAQPIVACRIEDLGIRRGERFTICKAEVKNGTRRGIEWQVKRVDPPAETSAPAPTPAATTPAHPMPHANGNGHAATVAPRPMLKLEDALRTALLAAKSAEDYGREIGKNVVFGTDEIKSMALTLVINDQKAAGARW